jgi:signal transduction histidine kinase
MTRPADDLWALHGTSLDGAPDRPPVPPAFLIDVAAGAILAANAAGWALWGCTGGTPRPATALDRAMPALQRLRAVTSSCSEVLTFWTRRGLLQLDCRIEPAGGTRLLLRGLSPCEDETVPMATSARPEAVVRTPATARLAHELRTPLSAVIAYAEVLKDEHFGPLANPRYREYARTIHDSARHALSVVDGTLSGNPGRAGLPDLAFRDLDPAEVIESCLAVAGPLAERAGLDLVADLGRDLPRIVADEVSVKQMLLNLVTNAIKFGRRGDKVTVRAACGSDGALTIDVADTGPGMGPGMRAPAATGADACGEGARRSGGRDGGLGIGLPLTRALAEANGASLMVESAPGRGTRVSIAFAKDRVVPV